MKTIHAFTETTNTDPGYVNISEQDDGSICVSVRTRGTSKVSMITVDRDQLVAIKMDIEIYLGFEAFPTAKEFRK